MLVSDYETSKYHVRKCCTNCDWFAKPAYIMGATWWEGYPVDVCPDCGDAVENETGQLVYRETKSGTWPFRYKETKYVVFNRRNHA